MELISWMETHPGTATWVQSIGALMALIVAIGFPIAQHRREMAKATRDEVDRRYTQVNFVMVTVIAIIEEIDHTRRYLKHELGTVPPDVADTRHIFENILLGFDAFPVHDLPTGPLVYEALQLRRDSHRLIAIFNEILEDAAERKVRGVDVDFSNFDNQLESLKLNLTNWKSHHKHWFSQRYSPQRRLFGRFWRRKLRS